MSRRQKAILVAIVLFVGLGLAWQFRKRGGVGTADNQPAGEWLAAAGPTSAPASGPTSTAPGSPIRSAGYHQPSIADPAGGDSAAPALPAKLTSSAPPDPTVPELATAFTGRPERSPHGEASPVGGPVSDPLGAYSARDYGIDPPLAEATHKVADGDTLPALAEHYLGSSTRWREIYEYNRDILTAPELLPIGGELRIPSGSRETGIGRLEQGLTARQSSLGAPAIPVSQSLAPRAVNAGVSPANQPPTPAPQTNLVPIVAGPDGAPVVEYRLPPVADGAAPSAAASLTIVPSAAPVPPVAKILRVAPRVYQVKPGDTLASISQRLYGDPRGQQLLVNANHDRLGQSTELRPGMTLVVPLAE